MHARSSTLAARRPRAVLVDPDAADRVAAARWLTQAGFDVAEAADFDQARRLLDTAPPALVVTAARLGAFNGLHLVITARAGDRSVAAVVMTHEEEDAVRAEAVRLGAGYLVKPLTRESLLELVGNEGVLGRLAGPC